MFCGPLFVLRHDQILNEYTVVEYTVILIEFINVYCQRPQPNFSLIQYTSGRMSKHALGPIVVLKYDIFATKICFVKFSLYCLTVESIEKMILVNIILGVGQIIGRINYYDPLFYSDLKPFQDVSGYCKIRRKHSKNDLLLFHCKFCEQCLPSNLLIK